jgi:hypothetical protein
MIKRLFFASILFAAVFIADAQAQFSPPSPCPGGTNCTFTGTTTFQGPAVHGSNADSGSNFQISGGAVNNTPIGGTTPNTGAFSNLAASGPVTGSGFLNYLAAPPPIGGTTPNTGAFSNLAASGPVTGSGFLNYLAAPPPIGGTTPNTGAFSNLNVSGTLSYSGAPFVQIGYAITAGAGVHCDGTTDDTSAINTYLATFTSGAAVYLPAGVVCLINSGNLTVPQNVRLIGTSSPRSMVTVYTLTGFSGLKINPAYSVILANGAQLENLMIFPSNLIANPTAAQVVSQVAAWGSASSVGVIIPPNISGNYLKNDVIEGFNTAIKAGAGQFSLQDLWLDCYNGIDVSGAGDNYYIDNVRSEPFYAFGVSSSNGSWARPGIFIYLHDGSTGAVLTRDFCFMCANGMVFDNVGVTMFAQNGFEWNASVGNGITGTVGIRWLGHDAGTSVLGSYLIGFDTGMSDEAIGEVIMNGITVPNFTVTGVYLGGITATPATVTIGGTPAAGNTVALTVTSSAVTGSPLTLPTYTVKTGDTTASIAQALESIIVHSQPLIAARIGGGASAGVDTIYWPGSVTATVSAAVTGGVTAAIGTGTVQQGSYGLLAGLDSPQVSGAAITAGDSVGTTGAWEISHPYLGTLWSGWLLEPNSNEAGIVSLSGVSWALNPTAPACGTAGQGSGTDVAGSLFVGSGTVTSCAVTFKVPFPAKPKAVSLMPTAASEPTPVVTALSATGFTVSFATSAGGDAYYYQVTP